MSSISDVTCKSHKQISRTVSVLVSQIVELSYYWRMWAAGTWNWVDRATWNSFQPVQFATWNSQWALNTTYPTKITRLFFYFFPCRFSVSGGFHIMSDGDPVPIRHFVWWNTKLFRLLCDLGILTAGIENGMHWPWPSRSFWPFWLRILGNLACLCDNLS